MTARLLRTIPDLVRISAARHVAYRSEMTIWILSAILPLIMLALWNAVVQDGSVAGFGQAEVARYFVAALVVRQLTGAWVIWELNHDIRTGRLSSQLLRPVHPIWVHAWWMLTAMPFRLAILSPLVVAVSLWRPDLLALPSPAALALFTASVAMAWGLNFGVQCAFGLLSFWLDKTDGLYGVWFAVWSLLSGYIAPLALFPDAWRPVLDLLPFRSMLAVPVELLGGFLDPSQAWSALGLQALWLGVVWATVAWLWHRGLARYGAFGA